LRVSHHSRFHRFFSQADWQMSELWKRLAVAVVNNLVAAGAVIWLAIDETACRKTGSKIYNAGMVFDNRPKLRKGDDLIWGLTWVVASIIVQVPLWPGRGFAIPISPCASIATRSGVSASTGSSGQNRSWPWR